MSSLNSNPQIIAEILAYDDDTADFFHEELAGLPQPRDRDSASLSTLATYNTTRSTRSSFYSLRRSLSRVSIADSVDLDGERHFTLRELCDFIAKHESLQTALIVSCSCYAVPMAFFGIPHRFLVIQLRRNGRKDVWMRLDRRPSSNVGPSRLSLNSGITPSNDVAQLASSLDYLLPPKASHENHMTFIEPCLLATLRLTLLDVIVVMDKYKLTSENCWAFCSLLQDDLFKKGKARFEKGVIHHINLAQKARRRLFHRRIAPILSPQDPSQYVPVCGSSCTPVLGGGNTDPQNIYQLSDLLDRVLIPPRPVLEIMRWAYVNFLASQWEDSDGFSSPEGQELARELLSWMGRLHVPCLLMSLKFGSQLVSQLMALCQQVVPGTGEAWSAVNQAASEYYVKLLYAQGLDYLHCVPSNLHEALRYFEEATSLVLPKITDLELAWCLHFDHAVTLHTLDRVDEAKRVVMNFVKCIRHEDLDDHLHARMRDLQTRAIWASEFDYLLERRTGDLPYIPHQREGWVQSRAYLPSSLSDPRSPFIFHSAPRT